MALLVLCPSFSYSFGEYLGLNQYYMQVFAVNLATKDSCHARVQRLILVSFSEQSPGTILTRSKFKH